ncbi:MAG: T9SS type A sorting domain-containing protein [Sphingobacteriales bacterium]|nr:MAG: T9SS type A sorting domain-containing protein [Sphingobacteriales bacterium]
MKQLLTPLLFLFATFSVYSQQTIDLTMEHDGITRAYRLYVPAAYNGSTPVPLLFNLHGYGSNNLQQTIYGDFRSIADTANFIICLPNGTPDAGGSLRWNSGFATGVDDVGFISNLIDTISANYSINPAMIYSTGMSNGGYMSHTLACELSDRIAAIASVTGSMTILQQLNCSPERPVPVMQIHGTNDPTVPYEGGSGSMGIEDLVDFWVAHNTCSTTPVITPVPDINTTDGSTAERFDYLSCEDQTSVAFYKVTGGGHTWPGSIILLAGTNKDFSASKVIWEFFRQFQHPGFSTPVSINEPPLQTKIEVYPNPSSDFVQVSGVPQATKLLLTDIKGQCLQTIDLTHPSSTVSIAHLPAGIYLFRFSNPNGVQTLKVVKW